MKPLKPNAVADARSYFSDELKVALTKQKISATKNSFEYVVDLLMRNMASDHFFSKDDDGRCKETTLFELFQESQKGHTEVKAESLQRLGDVALMVTGFFPDSLNRKLVDVDYYFGMGGSAYRQLSHLQLTQWARVLFLDLSEKFKNFADALGEVSTRSGLQNNTDLLRLYEKWELTKSDRLKNLLAEKGIANPISIDPKQKH